MNDDDIEYDSDATLPMSNSWDPLDSDNDLPKLLDMRGMVMGNINIPQAEECDSDGLFSDEEEEKPKRERLVYTESEDEKPKKKAKDRGNKVQRYLFTWNNPALSGDEFADFLKDIDAVTGFVFQLEVGENGTPHFQGYVEFSKRMYTTGVQSLLAPYRMSLLHAKGNKAQNYAYCTKEDTRTEGPWTYGTCSPENVKVKNGAQGKRSDMDVFADMVREKGGLTNEVIDAMPGHAMRYNKHARDLVQLQKVNDAKDAEIEMWKREYEKMMNGEEFTGQEQRKCVLYFGPTAVGKTTKVKMEVMGRLGLRCYEKQSNNKWWDGYDGELHVLMDEFKGAAYGPIEDFNRITNKGVTTVETKGSTALLVADAMYFTTNRHPCHWWMKDKDEPCHYLNDGRFRAVARRFAEVHWWNDKNELTVLKTLGQKKTVMNGRRPKKSGRNSGSGSIAQLVKVTPGLRMIRKTTLLCKPWRRPVTRS